MTAFILNVNTRNICKDALIQRDAQMFHVEYLSIYFPSVFGMPALVTYFMFPVNYGVHFGSISNFYLLPNIKRSNKNETVKIFKQSVEVLFKSFQMHTITHYDCYAQLKQAAAVSYFNKTINKINYRPEETNVCKLQLYNTSRVTTHLYFTCTAQL